MPKYIIEKVTVHWEGRGTETIKNVEVISSFTPNNDNRTKELLKPMFGGCKAIGAVYNVKKV